MSDAQTLTPRMCGPQGRVRLRIGGGPTERERHLVDFEERPVDLTQAKILVSCHVKTPTGSTFMLSPSDFKLSVESPTEVWARWYPKGTEIVRLGFYEFTPSLQVNGMSYPSKPFRLECVE